MSLDFSIYSIAHVLTAILQLLIAYIIWQRRHVKGGLALFWMLLASAHWSFSVALENAATTIEGDIFWSVISYPAITLSPIFYFLFAIDYTNQSEWIPYRYRWTLFIFPVLTTLMAITNPLHGWLWAEITPASGNIFVYNGGPWFWLHVTYSYGFILFAYIALIKAIVRFPQIYRRQIITLLIASIFPVIGNILYVFRISPPALDLTPISFALTAIMLAWNLLRYNLLDLVPIAHDIVIENLHDALFVLDDQNRIIDANPAAQGIITGLSPIDAIREPQKIIGSQIEKILNTFPEMINYLNAVTYTKAEISIYEGKSNQHFELNITPLLDRYGQFSGRLVLLHDITWHKNAEENEKKARQRAEILNEIIRSVASTLDLNEFLNQVYIQINRFIDARFLLVAMYDDKANEWKVVFLKETAHNLPVDTFKITEGLTGYIIETQQPLLLNNQQEIRDFLKQTGRKMFGGYPKCWMGVPLSISNKIVGVMATKHYDNENYYNEEEFALFTTIASQVAVAFENARLFAQIKDLATTDSLTGLHNRRHFFNLATHEFERVIRYHKALAVIMIDIDHFKNINDAYGHAAGDKSLEAIGDIFKKTLRKIDIAGRYGGEEFVILLPETSCVEAVNAAERLRIMIEAVEVSTPFGTARLTASLGIACLGNLHETLENLLANADRALYAAKEAGRNSVAVYLSTGECTINNKTVDQ
jgi:diguanylate cyclase (GGDEF)-like protein/PAS domain S-box-containing protein